MKKLFSLAIITMFPVLIIGNMLIFVSGIALGDKISRYEMETTNLRSKNIELLKEASHYDSLQFAASAAASMNFTSKSKPVVIDNLKYALNR